MAIEICRMAIEGIVGKPMKTGTQKLLFSSAEVAHILQKFS
jgi:hypothetical protein